MSFSFGTTWRIARTEILLSVRDGRAPIVFFTLALALAATSLAGMLAFRERQDTAVRTSEAEYQRWLNQGNKSSHSAAHFGQFVFPRRSPVSALESGVSDYQGSFVFLEAHTQKLWQFRPAEDRTSLFRFANVDAGLVLEVMVPLFIVLLLFAAIAGERESGTLQQIVASGVPIASVAIGKLMAAASILGAVVIPYLLIAAWWVSSASERPTDDLARLAMLAAGWAAYWWVFAALSMVVSARASTSRQALMYLLPLWFALCLAAPPAAAYIAGVAVPSPDGLTFAAGTQSDRYKLPVWYERLDQTEKRLLAQYSVSDLKQLPVSPAGIAMVEDEEAYDRLQEERFRSLYSDWEQQSRVYGLLGLIAPSLGISSAAITLSGADISHGRHFAEASERYRQYLVQAMNKAMITGQRPDALPYAPGYTPGAELWRTIRKFEYELPGAGWAARQAMMPMIALIIWSLLAAVLLWKALHKVRPT